MLLMKQAATWLPVLIHLCQIWALRKMKTIQVLIIPTATTTPKISTTKGCIALLLFRCCG